MLKDTDIHWFPLRISYASGTRLMKFKELLDQEATVIETFMPMRYERTSSTSMGFVPLITNYIFVRSTLEDLKAIKANKLAFEPLRYTMHRVLDEKYQEHSEILFVPDKRMEDFIRVSSSDNDKVIFLDNLEFACKPGQKVMITQGPFTGVQGVVKSIKKHLCVVLPIEEVTAVAIMNVPKKDLLYLPEGDKRMAAQGKE